MGSPAAAPLRPYDKDGQSAKQQPFHVMPTPPDVAVPPSAAAESATLAAELALHNDVNRVERLITQLEARSMALVPYGYGQIPLPPPEPQRRTNTLIIAGSLVGIWLSTVVLGIAYLRYTSQHPAATPAAVPPPLVIPSTADTQEQQSAASSVDHLAKALASSSERLSAIEAQMERSNRDLQKLANQATSSGGRHGRSVSVAAKQAAALPKNWYQVIEAKPGDNAIAHKRADGTVDYWLVPRADDKSQMTKVLTIGKTAEGVTVHSLEDGKNYTITKNGEWKNDAAQPDGK